MVNIQGLNLQFKRTAKEQKKGKISRRIKTYTPSIEGRSFRVATIGP
jgi:hypothetical protein